uniref:Uncharacterized protein n=1 Tax=Anguilla anguilla TaxID=7936 RepID=A0A0E9PB66_ANGAN
MSVYITFPVRAFVCTPPLGAYVY